MAGSAARRPGQHGVHPLSRTTRRRILASITARAEAGDLAAAEVLVRLSLLAEGLQRSPVAAAGAGCCIAASTA